MNQLVPIHAKAMVDSFGRRITYVRMSVTDRCDLRCRYCMAETMEFLPKSDILTFEELAELADVFIARGVTRILGTARDRKRLEAARSQCTGASVSFV